MLIKNRFGRVVEVSPERAEEMILKGEGFKMEEAEFEPVKINEPINELKCPYCGKECKNKVGVNKHIEACKKKHL